MRPLKHSTSIFDIVRSDQIVFKQLLNRIAMGQKNSKSESVISNPAQAIDKALKYLFQSDNQLFTLDSVIQPILTISKILYEEKSFQKRQDGFYVNPILLKCVHHQEFQKSIKTLIDVMMKQLKSLLSAKVLALVPRDKFRKILHLVNFCLFFTDQNLLQNINLLNVRTDLTEGTKEQVNRFAQENREVEQFIFESSSNEQLLEICKVLRLSIGLMVDLHLKLITRSDFTLSIIDRLNQSCFVFYCKLFFSTKHEVAKREKAENAKILLKIGSYFLGLGIDRKIASIYQIAVLLLDEVIQSNVSILHESKALPSHLFKSIPIINNNEVINWIICNILSLLKYKKHENKYFSKLNINRITSVKLLENVFNALKIPTQQITFMLEELCLQTKPSQIQRVYICNLTTIYSKFQSVSSEILKRFSDGKEISYNVKAMNKQLKVKPEDVRTELQNDEQSVQKQMIGLISKYIIHVIFHKNEVLYEYSDKALWNMILYHMQHSESELSEKNNNGNSSEFKEIQE